MSNLIDEKLKEFENKINLISESLENLKTSSRSIHESLVAEKENIDKIIQTFKKYEPTNSEIIRFNVGGSLFSTLKQTITKRIKKTKADEYYKPNLLEGLIQGFIEPKFDENKAIFIDRNPKYFSLILDYLRMANTENEFELSEQVDKKELRKEAKYYIVEGLLDLTESKIIKSNILNESQQKDLLKLCGFSESEKWKLLYTGSKDGFTASSFHKKCDNIPKSLVIIKSTNGNIFGGYTEAEWDLSGCYKLDPNAFIFSLINRKNNPTKFKISHGYEPYAIYCSSTCGPTFGGGHDIYLSDNSNSNTANYSNLGHSYKHSLIMYNTNEANTYLADSYHFQVEEIEVFSKK